jgi:hypothetical protein
VGTDVRVGQTDTNTTPKHGQCISRTGQSVLSLVRVFGGHNFQTGLGAIVLSITPLPRSRYLRALRRQEVRRVGLLRVGFRDRIDARSLCL